MNRFADVQIQRVANGGHLAVLENSIAQFVETAISESQSIEPSVIDTSGSSDFSDSTSKIKRLTETIELTPSPRLPILRRPLLRQQLNRGGGDIHRIYSPVS